MVEANLKSYKERPCEARVEARAKRVAEKAAPQLGPVGCIIFSWRAGTPY
jgi:hypothetical protein